MATPEQERLVGIYDEWIRGNGGDVLEHVDGRTSVFVNAPLALIEQGVQSQVALLARLDEAGLLKRPAGHEEVQR